MQHFEKSKLYFFSLLIFVSLLPYFILSLFAYPAGDDFVYACIAKQHGVLESAAKDYMHWSGRYVSNFFFYLNPLANDSLFFYRLLPVFLILLIISAFYFLLKTFLENEFKAISMFVASLLLTLLYLFQMPSLAQGIYWYTGTVAYQLANISMLFYIPFLVKYLRNNPPQADKIVHVVIILLMIFIIIGFNETIAIYLLLFHLILVIKFRSRQMVFIFLFSLICAALLIFSPGNAVRESFFPEHHQLFHSLLYSALQCFRFFLEWISGIPMLILSLLYIPVSSYMSQKSELFQKSFYLSRWESSLLLFIIIFFSAFPAYWSTGILGQHRTVNSAYLFFILMWFVNLTCWINSFQNNFPLMKFSNVVTKNFVLLLVFAIAFSICTKNGFRSISDLFSGKAAGFNIEMNERYSQLKKSVNANDSICVLSPLQNKPVSLFVLDITENENDWVNTAVAAYFGIKKVKLSK